MRIDNRSKNAKYWSEEKLLENIKEYENMFQKSSREFIKVFTENNYMNFEGKVEERKWYYYIKVLVMRKKQKAA